jgi:hypothetical protein
MDHKLIARLWFFDIMSDAQVRRLVSCAEDTARLMEQLTRLRAISEKAARWQAVIADGLPDDTTKVSEVYTEEDLVKLASQCGLTPSELWDLQPPDQAQIESVIGKFN